MSPASALARKTGIHRITTYDILKQLIQLWIVVKTQKASTTFFHVVPPEKLAKLFEERSASFKQALPEFAAIAHKFWEKPKIRYFEWEDAIEKNYYDLLTSTNEPIRFFLSLSYWGNVDLMEKLVAGFLPKRVEMWIPVKVIMKWEKVDQSYMSLNDDEYLKEVLIIDQDCFAIDVPITIYWGNKVAFWMTAKHELCGTIIESKWLHDTLKWIFDTLWMVHR